MHRLAVREHAIVAHEQLIAIGFSKDMIHRRVKAGALRPMHRGVYLVGPVAPPLAEEMAAVKACGERAYLSHRSAAKLWSLTPYLPKPGTSEVTVIARDPRQRGITVHRVRALGREEITTYKLIPVTTPARTLLDLAPELTSRQLERSLAEALRRRLVRHTVLDALIARNTRRPGVPALRRLLEADPAFTRSAAEERFLALIRQADLPAPEVNAKLGPYEIDFLWRDRRLAVEVDGWTFHSDRLAFEDNRHRDADLVAWGYRVIRPTWRRMTENPVAVIARVAAALAV
jgi:very-short-patch-repair endonuclease